MYDDWLAVKGDKFGKVQIAELFALKTTATFNPPMAAIEQKELRYNPYLVWLNGNEAHPALNSVGTPEAVYRRRDLLVKASLKEKYKSIKDVPSEVLDEFEHLEFRVYTDPTNGASLGSSMSVGAFRELLLQRASEYHKQEKANVS